MHWDEFRAAAPQIARAAEERFEGRRLVLAGTLRADGYPRISPVEPWLFEGDLLLGMMWRSTKALDLLRDPRVLVHSVVCDPAGTEGEVKLYGRAVEVPEAASPEKRARFAEAVRARLGSPPPEPYHLFAIDIERAAFSQFAEGRQRAFAWEAGGQERDVSRRE